MANFALLIHNLAPGHVKLEDHYLEPDRAWRIPLETEEPPDMIHRRLKTGIIQVFKRIKKEFGPYYDSRNYFRDSDYTLQYYPYELKREILEIEE